MTTMVLEMEKIGNKKQLIDLCKQRLSKDGAIIPEKNLVIPASPVDKTPMHPTEWNGRRVARERAEKKRGRNEEFDSLENFEEEIRKEKTLEMPKKKLKKGDGRKIDKVLSSLKIILADGIARSAKELLHILSSPPYSIDFIAEKPLNTLTSILSKETIHFKKTSITRVPNSLPILYTLKEFLKSKPRPAEEIMEAPQKNLRNPLG